MAVRRHLFATFVELAAFGFSVTAWAQPQQGINDVVRDATGAGIPGASVEAASRDGSVTRTAITGRDGSYVIDVPPGSYSVTATLTGFRGVTRVVELGGAGAHVDFTLQALLSEEITVTAMKRESTLIETPFSVVAPTEDMLRSRGVEGMEGLAANVGGFTVQNLGPGQSQVAMQGISAGQIVRDQPGVKEQVGT